MTTFRTVVDVPPRGHAIDYQTPVLLLGSCFAEHIGKKLERYRFPATVNPFGVIYNPVSVLNSLEVLMEEKRFVKDDLVEQDGRWHSFYHHSSFSSPDPDRALEHINRQVEMASGNLKMARFLFLSWGTAWVYEYLKDNRVVSNCHKIPAREFRRYRLDPEWIASRYETALGAIRKANPELEVIFTVSPIRHWKDGAVANQESKAVLHLAARELVRRLPGTGYFPSYEIVMDDLRDYRFYGPDMIHLNEQAVDYIWYRFRDALISREAHPIMREIDAIRQALEHRPFEPGSQAYREHLNRTLEKTEALTEQHPFLDLHADMKVLKERLGKFPAIE